MAVTNVRGRQLKDDDVLRQDLNTTTSGSAVIRKGVSGTGISLSSTGVDAGTGDVTISLAASGVTANTYGSASQIPVVTVDTYGRITAVSLANVAGSGGGTTVRYTETFTAIANQTVFTTTNTLTAGYYDVYLNGVRLNTSSYSVVDNSITLVDGATVGDIVDVVILGNLSVATTLPSQTGNGGKYLTTDGLNVSWATVSGSGSVTSVSVASANGFAGTVATATSTPAITLSTTVTGLLKGNGTAISAAVAGTDYQAGSTNLTSLAGLSYVSASFVKMTAAGTFALDTNSYYLASNPSGYTANAGTVTSVAALTIGTTGTDLSSTVATGTTTPVITLNVPTASATNRGALSSTDWSTFNGKQAALNGTGFVKISGTTISYDNSTYYLASNPSGYTTNTGTVTSVSVTTANGVSGSVATATSTPAITLTLGAITPTTVNGLTFTAAATGFTIAGGTTSKTLTVSNTLTLAGTDTSTLNIGTGGTLGTAAFTAATAYQASNTNLTSLAGLSFASTSFVKMTAAGTFALDTNTYYLSSNPSGYTANTGTVTSVSVTTANGVSGSVATATSTPAITLTLGAITPTSVNGLTLTAAATGFTIAGGTTSKTLTVSNTLTLAGTDTSTLNIGAGGTLGSAAFTASTAYQASNTNLTSLAGLTFASTSFVKMTAAGTFALDTNTYYLASNPSGYTTNTGTVTTVSVTTANGVSGSVATAGTTPAITLTLGAITPTSVNSVVISGSTTPTLAVTGTSSISGSNTGDNAVNSLYSGLVSNATHTGDATGATALTVVGLRGVALPALGASAGFLRYTGTGTNTWVFDTSTYLTANQSITLSGDISGTGTTAITTAIGANKVTNAMLAQVVTGSFLGRVTAATGNVETLTGTQATTLIDVFSSTLKGLAPASGGGTTNFLRADGTWTTPAGGGSVTTVSVVSANGFAGTVATATSTPAITLSTTITGVLKGNGTAISAAVANTDYLAVASPAYTGVLTTGTLGFTAANPLMSLQSSVNGFNQFLIQNSSTGVSASSDVVVNNNQSTDSTFYGDFGINGSNYSGTGSFSLPNAVYLYAASGDLSIGTTTSNAIHFVVNNGTADAATIKTTRQLQLPAYTTTTSFTGTAAGFLAFDASGNIITVAAPTGGSAYSVTSVSTTYSETATSGTKIVKATTAGGAFTITLPTAVGNTATIIIKKTAGTAALTVDGAGTETIDGGLTATLNKVNESITLVSDNSNWLII